MKTIDVTVFGHNAQVAGTDYNEEVKVKLHDVDLLKTLFELRVRAGARDFQECANKVLRTPVSS